jgi:anti-sigma B factor antagonist
MQRSSDKEQAMPATIVTSGNTTQVNLSGEFDFSSQDELNLVFEKVISSPQLIIQIDMQNTSFIDSSIIRMFLKLQETAKRNKKSMTIINCNERLYEILTIGGFDQIFDIR